MKTPLTELLAHLNMNELCTHCEEPTDNECDECGDSICEDCYEHHADEHYLDQQEDDE